jgi:hypothetical protein
MRFMSRLARLMLDITVTLSLLLFFAVLALWIRTYSTVDMLGHGTQTSTSISSFRLASSRGRVALNITSSHTEGPNGPTAFAMGWPGSPGLIGWWYRQSESYFFGFGNNDRVRRQSFLGITDEAFSINDSLGSSATLIHTARELIVPCWLLALLAAVLPAWRAARILAEHRRRRRQRFGLCPSCGYDLRATPQRCPECGHVPSKEAPV